MARLRTIRVTKGTGLADVLDEARIAPLLLEQEGTKFRVEACEQPIDDYDPEAVRRVVDEMAGSISEAEARALIADLYGARTKGSRAAGRP